jgi:hypothetical protein
MTQTNKNKDKNTMGGNETSSSFRNLRAETGDAVSSSVSRSGSGSGNAGIRNRTKPPTRSQSQAHRVETVPYVDDIAADYVSDTEAEDISPSTQPIQGHIPSTAFKPRSIRRRNIPGDSFIFHTVIKLLIGSILSLAIVSPLRIILVCLVYIFPVGLLVSLLIPWHKIKLYRTNGRKGTRARGISVKVDIDGKGHQKDKSTSEPEFTGKPSRTAPKPQVCPGVNGKDADSVVKIEFILSSPKVLKKLLHILLHILPIVVSLLLIASTIMTIIASAPTGCLMGIYTIPFSVLLLIIETLYVADAAIQYAARLRAGLSDQANVVHEPSYPAFIKAWLPFLLHPLGLGISISLFGLLPILASAIIVAGKYGARKGGLRVAILVLGWIIWAIGVLIIVGWVLSKAVKNDRESPNLPDSEGKESDGGSQSDDEQEGEVEAWSEEVLSAGEILDPGVKSEDEN